MILLNGKQIQIEAYPNGETRFPAWLLTSLLGNDIIGLRYESDADLFQLMLLKRWLDDAGIRRNNFRLVICYMPYSRMDRVQSNGDNFTLKYVCDFINRLDFPEVTVIDPHSDVTAALLDRCKVGSVFPNLAWAAWNGHMHNHSDHPIFVFPDGSAEKKYDYIPNTLAGAENDPFYVCHKHRNFQSGKIERLQLFYTGSENDAPPAGRTALIVDDLCSYGGTFVYTMDRLEKAGFAHAILCVAHCEDSIFDEKSKLLEHPLLEKIITTDSIPHSQTHPKVVVCSQIDIPHWERKQ